jgi:hypothetical protein
MPTLDYDAPRRQVAAIQRQLDATVRDIRNNKNLTDSGRRREIAAATLAAKTKAAQHRQEHVSAREEQRQMAERIAFGHAGGDPTASDRLAQAMLSRAILDGDEPLAKAIGAHAYAKGWGAVVGKYGATYGRESFITELDSIPAGPSTDLADQVAFRVKAPAELQGYGDADLQRLASTEVSG